MSLKLIVVELCLPVVVCLGLILAVPHIIAKSIVPALGMFSSLLDSLAGMLIQNEYCLHCPKTLPPLNSVTLSVEYLQKKFEFVISQCSVATCLRYGFCSKFVMLSSSAKILKIVKM